MNFIKFLLNLLTSQAKEKEFIDVGNEISSLAQKVLSASEIQEAKRLSSEIALGGNRKRHAIVFLQKKIGTKPKRPIYYVTEQFLPHLPHYTRDIMRYLGDYIDQLIKCVKKENHRGLIYIPRSLGINLRSLGNVIPTELQEQLIRYNRDIYVPAKHDFEVNNRAHRFTYHEVIFALYMTIKFSEKIKSISPMARLYAEDKLLSSKTMS